jgi:hypothetical protein
MSTSNQRARNNSVAEYSAGIELVLKDRLMREDWKQIFVKPEDVTEEKRISFSYKKTEIA